MVPTPRVPNENPQQEEGSQQLPNQETGHERDSGTQIPTTADPEEDTQAATAEAAGVAAVLLCSEAVAPAAEHGAVEGAAEIIVLDVTQQQQQQPEPVAELGDEDRQPTGEHSPGAGLMTIATIATATPANHTATATAATATAVPHCGEAVAAAAGPGAVGGVGARSAATAKAASATTVPTMW